VKADFGARIRWLRRQRGWTQKELADKAGVAHVTISRYERDEHIPQRLDLVERIAEALGVTPAVLRGKEPLPGAGAEDCEASVRVDAEGDAPVAFLPGAVESSPGIEWYKAVMERLAIALEESARAQHENGLANRLAQENVQAMLRRERELLSPHGSADRDAEVGAAVE